MSYATQKIVKNSIFLKVEQGQPHTIRLLDGEPTEQWQHKIGTQLISCTGNGCLSCMDGHARNQRFVTNVYDHTDQKVYLWSYGPMIAESLAEIERGLNADDESILNHDLEVSASGSGMQKKTRVQPRMKSKPVPKGLKLIEIKTGKSDDEPDPNAPEADENIGF